MWDNTPPHTHTHTHTHARTHTHTHPHAHILKQRSRQALWAQEAFWKNIVGVHRERKKQSRSSKWCWQMEGGGLSWRGGCSGVGRVRVRGQAGCCCLHSRRHHTSYTMTPGSSGPLSHLLLPGLLPAAAVNGRQQSEWVKIKRYQLKHNCKWYP